MMAFCQLFLVSCASTEEDIDIKEVQMDFRIDQFDQVFMNSKGSLDSLNKVYLEKYGDFYVQYIENVLQLGRVSDPALALNMHAFLNDKYIQELHKDVQESIQKEYLTDIENQLIDVFKRLKKIYPSTIIPKVYTLISAMQYQVVVSTGALGLSLDMFLGADYPHYPQLGLPKYFTKWMVKENIVPSLTKAWLITELDSVMRGEDFIDKAIEYGKLYYLCEKLMPDVAPAYIMQYDDEQWEWAVKNEYSIWSSIIEADLLYSKDPSKVDKFFNPAPFTSGYSQESPPRIGEWLGLQMVNAYMDNNNTSLQDLMALPAKKIFQSSKYKPHL